MNEDWRMEELIEKLNAAVTKSMDVATAIRMEMPEQSFFFFQQAELMSKAVEELKRNIPEPVETECGGTMWFFVCGDCHGIVDTKDKYCRHCGRKIDWGK